MRKTPFLLGILSILIAIMYLGSPISSACSSASSTDDTALYATASIYGTTTSNSYGYASYSGTVYACVGYDEIDVYLISQNDANHVWIGGYVYTSHSYSFGVGDAGQYVESYTQNELCGDGNEVSAAAYLNGQCYKAPIRSSSPAEVVVGNLEGLGTVFARWVSSLISSAGLLPIAPSFSLSSL
jgi:hypothetical protein